jgi:IS5 family transposase
VKKKRRREAFSMKNSTGFFDEHGRREKLSKLGDPLVRLNEVVDWEMFRDDLSLMYERERKSLAGRKPIDVVLMFKILILQRLHNLSDDQTEFMIRDRASFQRFLGLHVEHGSPDAKTIWKFRDQLKGLTRDLFFRFDQHLNERGFTAKGGQIIDATIVEVPRQRNTREENALIKDGKMPPEWEDQPNKLAQKDLDACWTKKRGQTYYGYKNHLNVDEQSKLIRDYTITDASVHDSVVMEDILDLTVTDREVYADSAYRSGAREEAFAAAGIQSRIHERQHRNAPLSDEQKAANREKSRVRVRVEHVFGTMHTSMNRAMFLRCIGSARACATLGLANLTYNIVRYVQIVAPLRPRAAV